MAVQFTHKPVGSIVGSGGYVFRHYGSEAKLITFYVSGAAYNAVYGMTWGEWINSKYNKIGPLLIDVSGYVYMIGFILCYDSVGTNQVKGTDVITEGTSYYLVYDD